MFMLKTEKSFVVLDQFESLKNIQKKIEFKLNSIQLTSPNQLMRCQGHQSAIIINVFSSHTKMVILVLSNVFDFFITEKGLRSVVPCQFFGFLGQF